MPENGGERFGRKRHTAHRASPKREGSGGTGLRAWFSRRSRWQRIGFCVGSASVLLAVAFIALVLSPLTSKVVTPRLIQTIEKQLGPGYSVFIGSSRVDVSTQGVDLKLDGFEIRDPSNIRVIGVPTASIALNGNIFSSQNVQLRRLKLTEPHLTLVVESSGLVSLAGSEGGQPLFSLRGGDVPQAAPAEIFSFIAGAEAVLEKGGPLASFELAEIDNASVTIDDRRRGRVEKVDQVDIRVVRSRNNSLTASASSASPWERWSLSATLSGEPGTERNFDLGFENLSLARLIYEVLRGHSPAEFGGQLFGHVYAKISPEGDIPSAEARLDMVGFHVIDREKPEARMDIERAKLQIGWNGETSRLAIRPIDISAQNSRFQISGTAHPTDEQLDNWSFSLAGVEQVIAGSNPIAQALRFDRIEVGGSLKRSTRILTLDKASVQGRSLSVAGYGSFDFSQPKPMADFAIAGSRSPVAAVLRVWPGLVASGARKWVSENVQRGMVEELSIAMRGPIGGKMLKRDIALDTRFSDATVTYLEDVPPAVGVNGYVRIVNEQMETVVEGGRVEMEGFEPLSVAGTRFSTLDHRPEPFQGEVAAKFEGPVSSAGALMAVPRLAQMAPGVSPLMRGGGKVSALLSLAGEYGKGADVSALVPRVSASLEGWSMKNAIGARTVDQGNFSLVVEPEAANLKGEVRLSGAPVSVEAIINRNESNKLGNTIVRFSLDPSKMKDFDNEALRIGGPVFAELIQDEPGLLANSRMRADVTGANVEGPVGLAKAAGQPGQVSFSIKPDGKGWQLENFVAQGSGIDIRGIIGLNEDGGLSGAQFSRFHASNGDDARLDVSKAGNAYKIAMRGSSFNMRPILKDVISGEPEKRGLDIDVEAKLGTVLGHNGEILTGADFRISRRGNATRSFYLSGQIGSGAVEGRTTGEGAKRVHSLRAADSGALLRYLDVYTRVRGGALTLDVRPGEMSAGRAQVQNFQVVGDQQLAMVASRPQGGQRVAANGTMTFTSLESRFRLGGGRILIDDFEVYGNELGATLGGEINYKEDRVGLSGTFVPAYALNNLFGKLPVIGAILGGGSDGGLVGITFAIDGRWTQPQMRVNPLSAVAPGVLRKLFEFRNQNPGTSGGARPVPQKQGQNAPR